MNMRSLNSFAGGAAKGFGVGSELSDRKRRTDLAGEQVDLLKSADKRAGDEAAELSQWMRDWRSRYQMRGAPGEGEAPAPATPVGPSVTQSPTPNTQPFAQQSAGAQPAPTYGRQRGLPAAPFDWLLG